jgi:hypothetical protein
MNFSAEARQQPPKAEGGSRNLFRPAVLRSDPRCAGQGRSWMFTLAQKREGGLVDQHAHPPRRQTFETSPRRRAGIN